MAKAAKKSESKTWGGLEILPAKVPALTPGLWVLFGDQRFLKLTLLQHWGLLATGEDDFQTIRLEPGAEWSAVWDELQTQSLFGGGGLKKVVIDPADEFVKSYRERLEDLLTKTHLAGVLVLVVNTWPANTRLYKALDALGNQVDCGTPLQGKAPDLSSLQKWIAAYAQTRYGVRMDASAARLLLELTDAELGRADSELAKLSLYVEAQGTITTDHVQEHVGGWRSRTMWDATEAMASGKIPEALMMLQRLLNSGEHPLALYGQMSWSLRRYVRAIEEYDRLRKVQPRTTLKDVVAKVGFWGPHIASAEAHLRRWNRPKVEKLGQILLETDLALKGSHSKEVPARLALEKLVLWLGSDV